MTTDGDSVRAVHERARTIASRAGMSLRLPAYDALIHRAGINATLREGLGVVLPPALSALGCLRRAVVETGHPSPLPSGRGAQARAWWACVECRAMALMRRLVSDPEVRELWRTTIEDSDSQRNRLRDERAER